MAEGLDIITRLPQAIIETILCLFPIEEATRTSILSKEWRYRWTKIPKLVFCQSIVKRTSEMKPLNWWKQLSRVDYARIKKDMRCRLFYVIHQVLLLRRGPIHEFTLSMDAHVT
ncbi:putative F-box-like domain superfamily protein [Helianthus annuus]|nr:putative F-box-like domain superfamily protein [Helianthus annuus]